MPTNVDDRWESLEWTDIEDLGGFENLLKEKAEKKLAPLYSCVCMHNLQASDRGDNYLCKSNLKSLGYFSELSKVKHRVKIHAQTCPKHPVSADESEQMLDETPHSIKYAFLHEEEVAEWQEEEDRKKEEAKEKKKEQKKKWAEREEWQEQDRSRRRSRSRHGGDRTSRPSNYKRSPSRGRRREKRSADEDRDRRSSDRRRGQRSAERSADRGRDKRSIDRGRDRRSIDRSNRDKRPLTPERDRRSASRDRRSHDGDAPLFLSSTGASMQMQQLILPGESPNFARMSPKNILLEWLTKAEGALGNARRVAEFCAQAFQIEGHKFEQASPG